MATEITYPEGLVPYHFAGMVSNPKGDKLSTQTQRVLLIAPFEPTGEETIPNGAILITSIDEITENFKKEDSTMVKMLTASLKTNPYVETYALCSAAGKDEINEALSHLDEKQYTQIATSHNDNESILSLNDELESRWGPVRQIDGHLFVAKKGEVNDLKEIPNALGQLKHVTILAASNSETDEAVWAASLAALNAKYATKPYLPYHGLSFPSFITPGKPYSLTDRDILLKSGISTHIVEGSIVKIDRLVTLYNKDSSYRDLNKKQILSYIRYDIAAFLKKMFPRHALSADETQADGDVVTPKSVRDLIISRHLLLKRTKYVQDPENIFKNLVKVEIDPKDSEALKLFIPVHLMGQLRRTVTTIAFSV